MICSLYNPYSIYFRMVVSPKPTFPIPHDNQRSSVVQRGPSLISPECSCLNVLSTTKHKLCQRLHSFIQQLRCSQRYLQHVCESTPPRARCSFDGLNLAHLPKQSPSLEQIFTSLQHLCSQVHILHSLLRH